jgi:membrane-bound lytic murein transglycosylase D
VLRRSVLPRLALLCTAVALPACRSVAPLTPAVARPEPSAAVATDPAPPPTPDPRSVALATLDTMAVPTTDEIARAAARLFGDSLLVAPAAGTGEATGGDPADHDAPTWDIDVRSYETHDRVAHYVRLFTETGKGRFQQRLSRGTRYEGMIRAKLRAAGMPEDLYFLPLVESGYDVNAYSRAAAVGMWQFMSSTGREAGLRIDWWIDERRDPVKATDAAIRFLRELQDQFGSLYLAAAAYNGGPGRVARGLARFADELEGTDGEDRFFALAEKAYLRDETKNYVPQIIAAALAAKSPARFGLVIDSQPALVYDSAWVGAAVPLAGVARAAGVELATLTELNPHVLRGTTPPSGGLWLRVPTGRHEGLADRIATLPVAERTAFAATTISRPRETLAAVAARTGVSARALGHFNPGLRTARRGRLVAGQSIRVPTALALAALREVPDPSIERYGPTATASTTAGRSRLHIVKRGESLGLLARRYGTTVARLRSLNGLRRDRVYAGQALVIRGTPAPARTARASGARRGTTAGARATGTRRATATAKSRAAAATAKGRSKRAGGAGGATSRGKAGSTASSKAPKSKARSRSGAASPKSPR